MQLSDLRMPGMSNVAYWQTRAFRASVDSVAIPRQKELSRQKAGRMMQSWGAEAAVLAPTLDKPNSQEGGQ